MHTLLQKLMAPSKRVGHGEEKVACCVPGDEDYLCTSSDTEKWEGYAEMNSNHTVLNSTKRAQTKPNITMLLSETVITSSHQCSAIEVAYDK